MVVILLEAELGVTPNGYSEPDFMGWEIKQFGVKKFDKIECFSYHLNDT